MGLIFQDGQLLFVDGQLAMHEDCCCDDLLITDCDDWDDLLANNNICTIKPQWAWSIPDLDFGGPPCQTGASETLDWCGTIGGSTPHPACWGWQNNPFYTGPQSGPWDGSGAPPTFGIAFKIECHTSLCDAVGSPCIRREVTWWNPLSTTSSTSNCQVGSQGGSVDYIALPAALSVILGPFPSSPYTGVITGNNNAFDCFTGGSDCCVTLS